VTTKDVSGINTVFHPEPGPKHGVSTKDSTIYCTHQPCIICSKMIINAGIRRVVYGEEYPDVAGLEILGEAGILTKKFI
jgi:dCMP deaminase